MSIELDELLFQEEEDLVDIKHKEEGWKILIVDDEEEVHQVTKLVLGDVQFEGKKLSFLHAYSSKEAKKLLVENPDISVVLLDVVMENDHSGLEVIHFIRKEMMNVLIRIILRTGQPGQAPEKQVILEYDINDYKEKTELTSQKLFSALIVALRSYRDLNTILTNKIGLENIISSSTKFNQIHTLKEFANEALSHIAYILNLKAMKFSITFFSEEDTPYCISELGEPLMSHIPMDVDLAFNAKHSSFSETKCTFYLEIKTGDRFVIHMSGEKILTPWDRSLLEIYVANMTASLENLFLNEEIESTQREIVYTLGEIAETRSKETGYHVKRVAEYSSLLARKYGLSEVEVELIRLASPMHDVGKIGISDDILNKPGKLTETEYEIMKTHAQIGYDMLRHSNRQIMKTAALIALQHHEKFNGTGYPQGLKGEEIHLYGRITAIADVFDALLSSRVYKPAWDLASIVQTFKEEKGKHFDPVLTDLFLENIKEFVEIQKKYRDEKVF